MKNEICLVIDWLFKNKLFKIKKIFILTGLYSILLLAPTIFSLKMLDDIIIAKNIDGFIYLSFLTFIILILLAFIDYYRSRLIIENVDNAYISFIRDNYVKILNNEKYDFEQINKSKNIIQNHIVSIIFDVPWTILYLIAFFLLHPILGFISTLIVCIQLYSLFKRFSISKQIQEIRINDKKQKELSSFSMLFNQINIMGMKEYFKSLIKENRSLLINKKNIIEKNYFRLEKEIKIFKYFFQITIITLGTILFINNELSLGSIIAINLLISKLLSPISNLYNHWINFLEIFYLIRDLLMTKEKFSEYDNNLKINYENKKIKINLIEKNKEIILESGDVLILLGNNGSGKSSIIKSIIRNSYNIDLSIGYLPQKKQIIKGSILEVISNFHIEGDLIKIKNAVILSGANTYIQKLKDGINTVVDTNKISLGELQKLLLARAFFGNPNLIILDEPENNLDYDGLKIIINSIKKLSAEGSTFIIITKNQEINNLGTKSLLLEDKNVEK